MLPELKTNPLLADVELGHHGGSIRANSCEDQTLPLPDDWMLQQENHPVYKVPGNATVDSSCFRRVAAYTAGMCVGGVIYDALLQHFTVKDGHVRPAMHSDGRYFFYGPGAHRVNRLFITVGRDVSLMECRVEHGNRVIVTVPPGFVGLAFDRGQPILLVRGLHQWKSDTMKMQELIDLSGDVIRIGPFTLLAVDEGYCAITRDNGKQRVLNGGTTHLLTNRNWKLEKLISLRIHTDDLGPFRATSADNVVLEITALVNWRAQDATQFARMGVDMMQRCADGKSPPIVGISSNSTLRNDVLKQATASLASAIGRIRYSHEINIGGRPDPRTLGYLEDKAYALGLGLRGRTAIRTVDEALWQAVVAQGVASDRFTLQLQFGPFGPFKLDLRTPDDSKNEPSILVYQSGLCATLLNELVKRHGNKFSAMFASKFTSCDPFSGTVTYDLNGASQTAKADRIMGCDGVSSIVRKAIEDATPNFKVSMERLPGSFKVV